MTDHLYKQHLFFIHRQYFFLSRWCLPSVLAAVYYSTKEYKNGCWLSILLKQTVWESKQSMKYLLNLHKQLLHQIHAVNKGRCYFNQTVLHVILKNMIARYAHCQYTKSRCWSEWPVMMYFRWSRTRFWGLLIIDWLLFWLLAILQKLMKNMTRIVLRRGFSSLGQNCGGKGAGKI